MKLSENHHQQKNQILIVPPENPLWKKGLIYFLTWSMLGAGIPLVAGTKKNEQLKLPGTSQTTNSLSNLVSFEDLANKFSTPDQMSDHYFNKGVDYAAGEQTEQSYNNFLLSIKALGENNGMAFTRDLDSLDAKTKDIYTKALSTVRADEVMQDIKQEQEKKGSGWWKIALGILGAAAAGYGISQLLKKKPVEENGDKDYSTTLTLNVYNHTQGLLKTITVPNIMTGSTHTVNIADLAVTGVDNQRIAARGPLNDCQFLGFDTDGDVSFTVSRNHSSWNFIYSIMLMNASNNANFQLMDDENSQLRLGPNITWFRGADSGPVGDESEIEKGFKQLNDALDVSYMRLGSITKTTGSGGIQVSWDNPLGNEAGRNYFNGTQWGIRLYHDNLLKYNFPAYVTILEEATEVIDGTQIIG